HLANSDLCLDGLLHASLLGFMEVTMTSTTVQDRRRELQRLCEQRQINFKDRIKGLPNEDDGLILAVLAATLKFNIRSAFDPSKSIADLDKESIRSLDETRQLEEIHRVLSPLLSQNGGKEHV